MVNGTYLTVIPQLSRRHVRASELQPMRRGGSCDDHVCFCDDHVMMHLVSFCYDCVMIHLVGSCYDYVMMHLVSSCYDRIMIHLVGSCYDHVIIHLASSCYDRVMIHLKSGFQLYRDSKTCNIIDFVSRYTRKYLFLCIVTPLYRALAFLLIRRYSVAPISVPFCHSPQEDVPSPCF